MKAEFVTALIATVAAGGGAAVAAGLSEMYMLHPTPSLDDVAARTLTGGIIAAAIVAARSIVRARQ